MASRLQQRIALVNQPGQPSRTDRCEPYTTLDGGHVDPNTLGASRARCSSEARSATRPRSPSRPRKPGSQGRRPCEACPRRRCEAAREGRRQGRPGPPATFSSKGRFTAEIGRLARRPLRRRGRVRGQLGQRPPPPPAASGSAEAASRGRRRPGSHTGRRCAPFRKRGAAASPRSRSSLSRGGALRWAGLVTARKERSAVWTRPAAGLREESTSSATRPRPSMPCLTGSTGGARVDGRGVLANPGLRPVLLRSRRSSSGPRPPTSTRTSTPSTGISPQHQELLSAHPDWVLRDGAGSALYIPADCDGETCAQYAADVGNAKFGAGGSPAPLRVLGKGYAGVFIDDVNLNLTVSDGIGRDVRPDDPRTGRSMRTADWRRERLGVRREIAVASRDRDRAQRAVVVAHSDDAVQRQMSAADLIELERGSGPRVHRRRRTVRSHPARLRGLAAFAGNVSVILEPYALDPGTQELELASYFLIRDGDDAIASDFRPTRRISPRAGISTSATLGCDIAGTASGDGLRAGSVLVDP